MIVSIVCIAIHQIAFILSLTVWRGYTVYLAMFLRPAGLTDETAAAAIAAAEAAPDIIRYWANSFVWLSFIILQAGYSDSSCRGKKYPAVKNV